MKQEKIAQVHASDKVDSEQDDMFHEPAGKTGVRTARSAGLRKFEMKKRPNRTKYGDHLDQGGRGHQHRSSTQGQRHRDADWASHLYAHDAGTRHLLGRIRDRAEGDRGGQKLRSPRYSVLSTTT